MASVTATFTCDHLNTDDHVPSPSSLPSWTSPDRNVLRTTRSFSGFTTVWTSHKTTRLSVSDQSHPLAVCLAHFPPLTPITTSRSTSQRTTSLVSASSRFVTIADPGGDLLRISLSDPILDPHSPTRLFTPPTGLILHTPDPPKYHYLPHPLQVPTILPIPDGHTLLTAFQDLPLILTRTNTTATIWALSPTETSSSLPASDSNPDSSTRLESHYPPDASFASDTPVISAPTVQLTPLYTTAVAPKDKVSAFVAHDAHGLLVLCLLCDCVLTGLSITRAPPSFKLTSAFRIRDVASAVPVLAVRRPHHCLDTLVRHSSGSLSLFMGRNRLCSVRLSDDASFEMPIDAALAQPVSDEFSLIINSTKSRRYTLSSVCFVSPLLNDCLAAITASFDASGATTRIAAVYHDLLAARVITPQSSYPPPLQSVEWSLFQYVLLRLVSPAIPLPSDSSSSAMSVDYSSHAEDAAKNDLGFNHILENNGSDIELDEYEDLNGEEATDDDWHALLNSDYHANNATCVALGPVPSPPPPLPPPTGIVSPAEAAVARVDILRQILNALHLLYEDRKLDTLSGHACRNLAALNHRLAVVLCDFAFIDHYCRDFPHLVPVTGFDTTLPSGLVSRSVPSLINSLVLLISGDTSKVQPYPCIASSPKKDDVQDVNLMASWRKDSPFKLTQRILHYYDILFGEANLKVEPCQRRENALLAMVADRVSPEDIDSLPFGVALPLRDVIWNCRQQPNTKWKHAAFALIGREDLFNFADFDAEREDVDPEDLRLIRESRALLQIHAAAASAQDILDVSPAPSGDNGTTSGSSVRPLFLEDDGDGCDLHGALFHLRFVEDKRIEEVRRVLRSTDQIVMTPVEKTDDSGVEFDMVTEQKHKLDLLLRKRFAAPVGRGAFTLRTYVPTDPTKPLPVPKICMTGKIFSLKGAKVSFTPFDTTYLQWGDFHNGVAAGLRIVAADVNRDSETSQILTRSWIVNHRPTDLAGSATHAGMLLAFGLSGYLPVLRKTDYYQYLVPRHELTAIGLMLGLSAGNIGSKDEKITKMLCLHVRPFNVAGFAVPDFQIAVTVQTGAILGLGFLHMGSCEHFLLEGLLAELGHRPKPGDAVDNREGLSLAAGFSIGLICLGHGNSAFDAADKRQIDRLVLYANGGPIDEVVAPNGHSTPSGKANGSGHVAANGQERIGATLTESETSRVVEGKYVNTDVVSPGALMALALIYMKTNNRRLAERITLPGSLYNLDRTRPDHVYLRLLTRSIIMWADIEASEEWIRSSVPQLLLPVNEQMDPFDLQGRAMVSHIYREHEVDVCGILQARSFAIAGACTAIALKYAGTCDEDAIKLLSRECEAFEGALLKVEEENDPMEYVYVTGLCSAALSVSIVAAGSGDLKVFRLLRRLRKRRGPAQGFGRYGSHVAMHMAIGFLFLGAGCQTFGTSDIAVVGLLCAIYPQWPCFISDNQYHLQAFRHLYTLAVEPRCVETRDVDTGTWCSVDVEIALKDGNVLQRRAPCIVPDARKIEEIRVVSDRYLRTVVGVNRAMEGRGWFSSSRGQVVFVKRKAGHLPFNADPKGVKGILARSVHRAKGESGEMEYLRRVEHLVGAFSADPEILAFMKYFCRAGLEEGGRAGERMKAYVEMVYECLSKDKADGVKVYVEAERAAEMVGNGGGLSVWMVASLVVAEAYLMSNRVCGEGERLVTADFIAGVVQRARREVRGGRGVRGALLEYVASGGRRWPGGGEVDSEGGDGGRRLEEKLAVLLRLDRLPAVGDMAEASAWVRERLDGGDGGRGRSGRGERMLVEEDGEEGMQSVDMEESMEGVDERLSGVSDAAVEALLDAVEFEESS